MFTGRARCAPRRQSLLRSQARSALLIWKVLSRECWMETFGGQGRSWPGSGRGDGDHSDIRGSAEPEPHDSEPSPRCPSHFWTWVGTTKERTRVLGNLCQPRPRPALSTKRSSCRGRYLLEHLAGGPDEASQFAGDRRQRLQRPDARAEMAIACMQPQLGTPGELDDFMRHVCMALFELARHAWGMPRMVGSLTQDVAQQTVAGLGNRPAVLLAATGRLGCNQTTVGHELGCGAKTTQITSFSHQRDGAEKANAAEGLKRADERDLAGVLGALVQGRFQAFDAFTRGRHFGQVISEDDTVGQVFELELPQPLHVTLGPGADPARRPTALTQQQLAQSMFGPQLVSLGIGSGTHQAAQRLVRFVRHPDRCEITTAQQPGELQRVTPIGLDLITRLFGDQRWRHDDAVNSHLGQLAVQRVTRRSSLVGHAQLDLRTTQPRHQLANCRWIVGNAAVTGWRTRLLGDRHRNTHLVYIQTDVPNLPMLHHGHWADLHVCSSTQDELRPPAQPTLTACAGPSILTSRPHPPLEARCARCC